MSSINLHPVFFLPQKLIFAFKIASNFCEGGASGPSNYFLKGGLLNHVLGRMFFYKQHKVYVFYLSSFFLNEDAFQRLSNIDASHSCSLPYCQFVNLHMKGITLWKDLLMICFIAVTDQYQIEQAKI